MVRLALLIVATMIACGSKSTCPAQCIYENTTYSIGATVCAPGQASAPAYVVLECHLVGHDSSEGTKWMSTGSPCTPVAGKGSSTVPAAAGSAR